MALFVLMVLGIIEVGRIVMVPQVCANASREGTQIGVLDEKETAHVLTAVGNDPSNTTIGGANVTVTPAPPGFAGYRDPVTVEVSVPLDQVSWLRSPMFLGGTTLTARMVMRLETGQKGQPNVRR